MTKPRVFTKEDRYDPVHCVEFSVDHLNTAEVLFATGFRFFDSVGYLAHMGGELLLKAWLPELTGQFEGVHSLQSLHTELVRDHGAPALDAAQSELLRILDEYGELRYPAPNPPEVGNENWAAMKALIQDIAALIPDRLFEDLEKVPQARKGARIVMQKKRRDGEHPARAKD